jgi:hypothetical protein
VRAGEGESEAENYVLTNPVAKTSMSSGLSQRGKAQVCNKLLKLQECLFVPWIHKAMNPQGHAFGRCTLHAPGC